MSNTKHHVPIILVMLLLCYHINALTGNVPYLIYLNMFII